MTPADLIQIFEDRVEVPIDVNEVVDIIRGGGIKHDIFFYEVSIDHEALRGSLYHWTWTTEPPRECADVFYAGSMSRDWQRLVCCKELLHILDPEYARVTTAADVKRLVQRLALPTEMQDPPQDGIHVISDRFRIYQAVAVLFPMATRNLLLAPYGENKLTITDIARIVDLPQRYVALVMSDVWDEAYKQILAVKL